MGAMANALYPYLASLDSLFVVLPVTQTLYVTRLVRAGTYVRTLL
jgi:hypothetical protein